MRGDVDHRTVDIIGALIEVHRYLGPGMLEIHYETALCHELTLRGIPFERQQRVPLDYKGLPMNGHVRLDLVVRSQVVLELKAIDRLLKVHEAQLVSYLRFSGLPLGLLVNFNVAVLMQGGLRRLTREPPSDRA